MANVTGTAEEREEVRELYARYAFTIDHCQYEEWIDCFTEDGVFESVRFGRHAGRDGLRRFTRIYRDSLGGAVVRHVTTNVMFTLEGDYGTGACYFLYYHCKDAKVQQASVGTYKDTLRKVNGRWLFASRQVSLDAHW